MAMPIVMPFQIPPTTWSTATSSPHVMGASNSSTSASYLAAILLPFVHYARLYGIRALLVGILSIVTVYRRDLSCNRVYIEEEEVEEENSTQVDTNATENGGRRLADSSHAHGAAQCEREDHSIAASVAQVDSLEALLESAGVFCSGGPILPVVLAVWGHILFYRSQSTTRNVAGGSAEEVEDCDVGSSRGDVIRVAWAAARAWASDLQKGAEIDPEVQAEIDRREALIRAENERLSRHAIVPGETGISPEDCYSAHSAVHDDASFIPFFLLPPDMQVRTLSFLHPWDITTFACVSRSTRSLIDDDITGDVSRPLWKKLWWRDYGSVLEEWDVGREAIRRSLKYIAREESTSGGTGEARNRKCSCLVRSLSLDVRSYDIPDDDTNKDTEAPETKTSSFFLSSALPAIPTSCPLSSSSSSSSMKEFYLTFPVAVQQYLLAGHNSPQSKTLVGLHGHIFDITNFVESHPGSPETLIVASGLDATGFFEDLGHSLSARRLGKKFCALIDAGCCDGSDGCGLYFPPPSGPAREYNSKVEYLGNHRRRKRRVATASMLENALPQTRSNPRKPATLCRIVANYESERRAAQREADAWLQGGAMTNGDSHTARQHEILGNVNVYYDPFGRVWRSWYTGVDLKSVHLDRVGSGGS